ncbi:hypothetical protein EGY00_02565, partial [Enterococcus faecium]|uniref:hypothetical protein n=1 Tax=Enterococcus faecium TaxID=1352 RepID=UPI000FB3A0C3
VGDELGLDSGLSIVEVDDFCECGFFMRAGDLVGSEMWTRGLGDVYEREVHNYASFLTQSPKGYSGL